MHQFDPVIAARVGVNAAVLYRNIDSGADRRVDFHRKSIGASVYCYPWHHRVALSGFSMRMEDR